MILGSRVIHVLHSCINYYNIETYYDTIWYYLIKIVHVYSDTTPLYANTCMLRYLFYIMIPYRIILYKYIKVSCETMSYHMLLNYEIA